MRNKQFTYQTKSVIIDKEIESACPKCKKIPRGMFKKVGINNHKCPICGYIGTKDTFIHK